MSYDLNDKEILYAYECIIRNTRATARWLQMHEEAKGLNFTSEQTIEAFGHPPVWRGVGVVHKSEYISPTYPQTTRCKKRAEAAAINAMMGFGYEIFDEDQRQPIEVTQIEEPADTEVTDAEFKTVVEPAINVEVTEPVKVKPANEVRPFSSERLGEVIAAKAEKYRKVNQEASDNERKKLIATLNQLTQGDDNLRHSLTNYLCGVESTKDLDSGNVLALLEWLKPTTDSGGAWVLDGMAVKEYLRIHEEVFSVGVG